MGVYINGMEMPSSCYKCPLRRRDGMDIVCPVAHERFSVADVNILEYRLDNCPLVPAPPHGRLIDADALRAKQQEDADLFQGSTAYGDKCRRDEAMNAVANIVNAPTIIPAESAEEG